jgi:hypothetical protein
LDPVLAAFAHFLFLFYISDIVDCQGIIRVIKSRRIGWAGHVARMGEKRNAYRILVGKPEGKRPLGRPRRRWVGHREIGWDGMVWIYLAQDRDQWRDIVNTVMSFWVP